MPSLSAVNELEFRRSFAIFELNKLVLLYFSPLGFIESFMNGAFTFTDVPCQSVTRVSALAAAATKVAAAPMKINFFIS
jgi:hypothetical protein